MAATETLSRAALGRATLARQMLLRRERTTVPAAIERLLALQAQWPRPPFVGLWTRVEGFERSQLTVLLQKRKVLRATFVRGTLHMVTARDYVALRSALQPMLDAGLAAVLRDRARGLDAGRLVAQARRFLADGPRTFEEVRARLAKDDPKGNARAMGYAVRMSLPLVQVPGGEAWAFPTDPSFAAAEDWLGRKVPADREPPDALVLRYLAGYGPASVADMQAWTGFRSLRETVEALRPRLRAFRDGKGREVFDLPDAPRPAEDAPAPVRLLPEYDNVITARTDDRFVATADRPRVYLSALRIAATVLVDGQVSGTWKVERKKTAATLVVMPFAPFTRTTKQQVEAEGDALLRFAEPDATVRDVRFAK
jgi:hypothetical protein